MGSRTIRGVRPSPAAMPATHRPHLPRLTGRRTSRTCAVRVTRSGGRTERLASTSAAPRITPTDRRSTRSIGQRMTGDHMTATATTRARYLAAFLLVAAIGILLWQVTASSAKSPPKSKARGAVAEQSQSYSIFLRPPVAADASVAHWKAPGDPRIGARLAAGRVVHRDAVRTVAAVPIALANRRRPRFQPMYADRVTGDPPRAGRCWYCGSETLHVGDPPEHIIPDA